MVDVKKHREVGAPAGLVSVMGGGAGFAGSRSPSPSTQCRLMGEWLFTSYFKKKKKKVIPVAFFTKVLRLNLYGPQTKLIR